MKRIYMKKQGESKTLKDKIEIQLIKILKTKKNLETYSESFRFKKRKRNQWMSCQKEKQKRCKWKIKTCTINFRKKNMKLDKKSMPSTS